MWKPPLSHETKYDWLPGQKSLLWLLINGQILLSSCPLFTCQRNREFNLQSKIKLGCFDYGKFFWPLLQSQGAMQCESRLWAMRQNTIGCLDKKAFCDFWLMARFSFQTAPCSLVKETENLTFNQKSNWAVLTMASSFGLYYNHRGQCNVKAAFEPWDKIRLAAWTKKPFVTSD